MTDQLHLGPAVIVRAAAWPIESLDPFGDRSLAESALAGVPDYWGQYAAAVEREREVLWKLTALDEPFAKALAISNSALAERARGLALRRPARTKRVRHVETSLYRYLARAASRTEPCDLWAGVQLATFGESDVIEPAIPKRSFAPDLRPFQAILRALGQRQPYRLRSRYRANATLDRAPEGSWRFLARRPDGRVTTRELSFDPGLDAILSLIRGLAPTRLFRIVERLAHELGIDVPDLIDTLDALIAAGVLVGGLDLPVELETPWHALRKASRGLVHPERGPFRRAVVQLRALASELEDRFDALSSLEIAGRLRQAELLVETLAAELEIVLPEPPRALLRCDLRLPHRIVLGREQRRSILSMLEDYEWAHRAFGPGVRVRAARAEELRRLIGEGLPIERIEVAVRRSAPKTWRDFGVDVAARVALWEALAAEAAEEVACPTRSIDEAPFSPIVPPFGVLMIGPSSSGRAAVRGIFDEIALIHARFAPLFGERDLYREWLDTELARFANQTGRSLVELLAPYERNPNTLARPRLVPDRVELWTATPGVGSLAGARALIDPSTGLPYVETANVSALIFSFASAANSDPASELLLRTSFRDSPAPSFVASSMAFGSELAQERFSPRVSLRSGAILRPRRTVLSGDALRKLLDAAPPERYRIFQKMAVRHRWPQLISIRRDAEHPLLMKTNSPLALESILEGARRAEALIIEEQDGTPWLTDSAGCHYVTELAVPFSRDAHSWSRRS